MLHITNSLTRTKEEFVPITPGQVRMYVCGMTVYDLLPSGPRAGVGGVRHGDALAARERLSRSTYVRNITDIDDKIIKRAAENGETIRPN